MTPKRPYRLNWVGTVLPDGRPERYLEFMPVDDAGVPRNLTAEETDALTQDQLTVIRNHPDLYSEVSEPKASKKAAPAKKAATSKPEAPQATEDSDAGNQQDTAAQPATEGEGE